MAPLYADVRPYRSHVKIYCRRARLLFSHTRLFTLSLMHSFIHSFIYSWSTTRYYRTQSLSVSPNTLETPRNEAVYLIISSTGRALRLTEIYYAYLHSPKNREKMKPVLQTSLPNSIGFTLH